MLRTPPLLRGEHKRKIWFRFYLMERIIRNSMRIGKSGLIFTIVGMFLKIDIPLQMKELKQHTGYERQVQKCFCKKNMSASVRKIIRTSLEDSTSEMFDILQLHFFQNDTHEKTNLFSLGRWMVSMLS